MNRITLTFLNPEIESSYQDILKNQSQEFQQSQKWILLLLGLFYLIIKSIEQDWFSLGFIIANCLFVIIIFNYKLAHHREKLYDVCLVVVVLGYNLYNPIMSYLYSRQLENLYVEGYLISVGTLGYNFSHNFNSVTNIFNFRSKTLIIGLIVISLFIFAIPDSVNYWKLSIKAIIFISFYIQNSYCFEKYRKILFLEYVQRKTILKGIYDFTNVSTYVVHYITEKRKIELVSKDDKKEIEQQVKNDFEDYLQNMKISRQTNQSKYASILTQDPFNKEKKVSLKQFLYGVFLNDERKKVKTILIEEEYQEVNQLIGQGVYEQEYYSIYVIKSFDVNPCIILALQEKQKQVQFEEIQLKNKMLKKSLDQTQVIFQHEIRMALIYFKWIYKHSDKIKDIILINKCLQSIHGRIIKAYNEFQNIVDFHSINTEFQQSLIKQFDILNCIEEITRIISHSDINKEIRFLLINNLEQNTIMQDEKYLQQLFYNLLFFASNSSQTITITLEQETHGSPAKQVIKVRIDYQGPNLSIQQLQGLQIINPQNLGELLHNTQKPLDLELPLALMIIRKIGPYDKIRLQQNKCKQNFIEFYLFAILEDQYHLIPAYSLHPLTCIILKKKHTFSTKLFTSFYEKMQISPRINLSSYNKF